MTAQPNNDFLSRVSLEIVTETDGGVQVQTAEEFGQGAELRKVWYTDNETIERFAGIPPVETGGEGENTYLCLRTENCEDWGDKLPFVWHISVIAVSIDYAGEDGLKDALDCAGRSLESIEAIEDENDRTDAKIEALVSYGIYATLWQGSVDRPEADDFGYFTEEQQAEIEKDKAELRKEALTEMVKANMLIGFYLDRRQNVIGATGWDLLKGNVQPPRS